MRGRARSLGAACALAVAALAPGEPAARTDEPARRPSVLLVTIDTLRADRLAAMPVLRGLAARGASFERAYAEVPLTLPSHATMLTGRGPLRHTVRDNVGHRLPDDVPTLAETFSRAGYATAAFVGGYPLRASGGLARGFDRYDDAMTRTPAAAPPGHSERRAEEVAAAAAAWLASRGGRPYFAWVHFFDPHDPYEAPAPFAGRRDHPYDDEVAYADDALGALVAAARSTGGPAPWIAVASDHGESLGEHGEATHGVFLYDSTLRVPLVIAPPAPAKAVVVGATVSLADLAPTLLAAAGLPPLPGTTGRSLLPALDGRAPAPPDGGFYVESVHGRRRYGWAPLYGFLDWPWKLVAAPRPELYHLVRDPREADNVYLERRARASKLEGRLRAAGGTAARPAASTVDAAALEILESLGYVGGGAGPAEAGAVDDRPRPDPKDRIGALAPLERGLRALAAGRLDDAEASLRGALRHDPDNVVALNNLGLVALRRGEAAKAAARFRRALATDPAASRAASNLGLALSRLGRHAEAVDAYRRALDAAPGFTAARFNLALALHRSGRHREALAELDRVAREEPDFPDLEATRREILEASRPPGPRPPVRSESW